MENKIPQLFIFAFMVVYSYCVYELHYRSEFVSPFLAGATMAGYQLPIGKAGADII